MSKVDSKPEVSQNEANENNSEESTVTFVTPYKAAKIVNEVLTENELKNIPTQMMYNYTTAKLNANKNPIIKFDFENGIDLEALSTWIEKYVAKKLAAKQA